MSQRAHHQLVDKIVCYLADGIKADESITTYIDSTFSNPSLTDINRVISDESHVERDSLIDLLIFPDETFQLKLEPLLIRSRFSQDDEYDVIDRLSKLSPAVMIYLSSFDAYLKLILTSSTVTRFVRRLNITWQPDDGIRATIEKAIAVPRRPSITLRLRNANLNPHPAGAHFLCRFMEAFDDNQPMFLKHLGFVVDFIGTLSPAEDDPYPALMKAKYRLVSALRRAIKFEQQLACNNMETLMLQGVRPPAESSTYFRENIALIDDIALVLFGRSEQWDLF